jgi:HPt (histidine-containing phosphotransfer) domain-containing protein
VNVELDQDIFELILWLMAAHHLQQECRELENDFPDLLDLVDAMQAVSKKLIRSADRQQQEAA